ncbi:MAG TPA: TPM domain-containing protein [Acidobacteriaceae bacterium]|nr:TPM domain-containing protein [Acidobacteriaceae bacterium]
MARALRWLVCVVLLAVCGGLRAETVETLPAPSGYVNDFAGVLAPQTVTNLDALLVQLDRKAHAQIAVVTVKSLGPDKSGAVPSIEEFAVRLEEKWKVGPKGTDRGLLVIVSLNPRKYRIEVGYGLEGLLNDAKVGDIGRDMRPYLQRNDYDRALTLGVGELAQDIAADAGVTLEGAQATRPPPTEQAPAVHVSLLQTIVFGIVVLAVLGVLIGTGNAGLLFFFLLNMLGGGGGGGGGRYRGGGGDDFGGGGFGGGGGGFGGFGGGSSGGGGASGDF